MLEEAYEVVDAVDGRNFDALADELGDLLLEVLLYARLAEEESRFTIAQVIERLHAKLVRRHPHVFGEKRARTAEEALESWLGAKEREQRERSAKDPQAEAGRSALDGMARALPRLLEAHELSLRASQTGFEWPDATSLIEKVEEEIREIRREWRRQPSPEAATLEEEIGDLLFATANLARHARSDAESCLRRANLKFRSRFREMERRLAEGGRRMRDSTPQELDALWNEVKKSP